MANFVSKSLQEIKEILIGNPRFKSFTHQQIHHEIYNRGTLNFNQMTSLSKMEREALNSKFKIEYPQVLKEQKSVDGTIKWLLGFDENETSIETVFIPDLLKSGEPSQFGTLCVSSQVGCSLKCSFCHTGTQKFKRNLTSSEIVGQVMHAMQSLGDFPLSGTKAKRVDNIVFMVGCLLS